MLVPESLRIKPLIRATLVSDGFCIAPAPPTVGKVKSHHIEDVFRIQKQISSSEAVRKLTFRRGFETSPAGKEFKIVIISGYSFKVVGFPFGNLPGYIDRNDVRVFAQSKGFDQPTEEVGYHLCRRPEILAAARKAKLKQLVIMSRSFLDHKKFDSRWAVSCAENPDELLILIDASNSTPFYQNDGFVYIEDQSV